jgi:dihydropteroate synthase
MGPMPRTILVGILNVTPDSFSDGGQFASVEEAVATGLALVVQAPTGLDVGASPPGQRHAGVRAGGSWPR